MIIVRIEIKMGCDITLWALKSLIVGTVKQLPVEKMAWAALVAHAIKTRENKAFIFLAFEFLNEIL